MKSPGPPKINVHLREGFSNQIRSGLCSTKQRLRGKSSFFFVPEFENRLVSLINVAEAGGQGKKARRGLGGNNKASSPLSAAAAAYG